MTTAFVVLTAVGPDRVGIVDDISGAVSSGGCNIEESKMAVLGGDFAVIMLISGPASSVDSVARSLPALGKKLGLTIDCHPTHEPRSEEKGRPYLLKAVSLDTPGIVHAVTDVIRRYSINIEDLETETAPAPWTGAPMFRLSAHLVIGPSVSISSLKQEFSRLQQEHDLDIDLKPVFALGSEPGER
ncbi:MAG TPA: ACT domain-containing protein [Spirochaetia bacterium]|nr:ACT domain-containing protein [Spirochaetia bacterium]